jgi:hypothetical protein
MRFRMLRGEWINTGNKGRDAYLSHMGLARRLAQIEAGYLSGART